MTTGYIKISPFDAGAGVKGGGGGGGVNGNGGAGGDGYIRIEWLEGDL